MRKTSAMSDDNIWSDTWDAGDSWSGGGGRWKRLSRGTRIGATVYELDPGNFVPYHFHHASEEMLLVLDGEVTLRTEEGERKVGRGEVVVFPVGPSGAHGFTNDGNAAVRYVMASSRQLPEVVEYPDLRKITAQAPTGSQTGEELWLIHDLGPSPSP
jgi:uncharacterized cupin superfamily protein